MSVLPDGLYFDLPERTYHGLSRLSASGVCNLRISPATFWARSWMNPERDDDEKTDAQIIGSAYHIARLEPDRFAATYARQIDKDSFDGPATAKDMAEILKSMGQPIGGTVLEQARRLRDAGFEGAIYQLELEEWEAKNKGKVGLKPETFDQIVADTERLHHDPDIAQLLEGGWPEVSILWTDEKTGLKWKARLDYLTLTHIADIKTFDNAVGKELDRCLADAVRFNRYYIPAVLYWQAVELVREGKVLLRGEPSLDQQAFFASLVAGSSLEYWWVFVEKSGIPNILARQFRMTADPHPHHLYQAPDAESREEYRKKMQRPAQLFEKARLEIDDAARTYQQCVEIWGEGDEPWGTLKPIDEIGDADFNPNWLAE